jgi:predicted transcriptional regulator of viral defense system
MSDTNPERPDHTCLFDAASEQHGYFTTEQAHRCGFGWRALHYHAARGRFVRVRRGLYRLRDYPSSPREEVVAAWLAAGPEAAVSHESALDLLELADVTPDRAHVTVPRSRRGAAPAPGVTLHTTGRPLRRDELTTIEGVRLTSAARAIADAAESGVGPEQIELAVVQALQRGLTTPEELREQAGGRGRRVAELVQNALERAQRAGRRVTA